MAKSGGFFLPSPREIQSTSGTRGITPMKKEGATYVLDIGYMYIRYIKT